MDAEDLQEKVYVLDAYTVEVLDPKQSGLLLPVMEPKQPSLHLQLEGGCKELYL